MATNIITAVFSSSNITYTKPAYQYDYGMILKFSGIDLPQAYEVHFSNTEFCGESISQIGDADGVTIDDVKRTVAEAIHDAPRGDRAHTLNDAGGEVFENGLGGDGHLPSHGFGLELFSIAGVAGPAALQFQRFAGVDAGHTAHCGDLPTLLSLKAQNGIAVLLVAEENGGYAAGKLVELLVEQFSHGKTSFAVME